MFLKADRMFELQTSSIILSSDTRRLPQEQSSVVYTTVDFRAHQRPTEANLSKQAQAAAADSTWSTERDGMVEYSTLAIQQ